MAYRPKLRGLSDPAASIHKDTQVKKRDNRAETVLFALSFGFDGTGSNTSSVWHDHYENSLVPQERELGMLITSRILGGPSPHTCNYVQLTENKLQVQNKGAESWLNKQRQ